MSGETYVTPIVRNTTDVTGGVEESKQKACSYEGKSSEDDTIATIETKIKKETIPHQGGTVSFLRLR